MAKQMDNNYLNYLTNKAHFFYLNDEKDEAEKQKTIKKIFDKSDLKSDQERSSQIHTYNNMEYIN